MTHLKFTICCEILLILGATSDLECGPNEIKDDCPATCETDYCPKNEGQPQACPQPDPCPLPACKCQFNYRRDDNKNCIPIEQCPPFECNRPNEVYTLCPSICPDDCAYATPDGQCPLTFGFIGIVIPCSPQCRCQRNYWRRNGTCISLADC